MDQENLIEETNALLKQILELEATRKAEAEKSKVEIDQRMAEMMSKRDSAIKDRLGDLGGDDSSDEWDKRLEAIQAKSKERMASLQEKDEQHKAELIQELRTQSDLLRQIAEKLGA